MSLLCASRVSAQASLLQFSRVKDGRGKGKREKGGIIILEQY